MRTQIATFAVAAAMLVAAPALAQQQPLQPQQPQASGSGQFCLKGATGPARCEFQTMAQCEQAKPAGSTDQCIDMQGTVGAGGSSSAPSGSSTLPKGN
jgi:hypothetical protein